MRVCVLCYYHVYSGPIIALIGIVTWVIVNICVVTPIVTDIVVIVNVDLVMSVTVAEY